MGWAAGAAAAMEDARRTVARVLNCQPAEIVFTSCGTESDNLAIRGVGLAAAAKGQRHLITTPIEHHAVLHTMSGPRRTFRLRGHPRAGGPDRPGRPGRGRSGDPPGHRADQRHAGQQRGGHGRAGRRDRRHRPAARRALPHGCGAGRGQPPAGCRSAQRRPARALRAQVPRPEGRRAALRAQGRAAGALCRRAAARSGAAGREPKTCPTSWAWRGRWSWPTQDPPGGSAAAAGAARAAARRASLEGDRRTSN